MSSGKRMLRTFSMLVAVGGLLAGAAACSGSGNVSALPGPSSSHVQRDVNRADFAGGSSPTTNRVAVPAKSLRPHSTPISYFGNNTVLDSSNRLAKTLLVITTKTHYFFQPGSNVTFHKPYLLVRAYSSLWTLKAANITQIRHLDQPTSTNLPPGHFNNEQNTSLTTALDDANAGSGTNTCPDCAFPVARDFVKYSPYGGETPDITPSPVPSGSPECGSGICDGDPPSAANVVTNPNYLSPGALNACAFPKTWSYSGVLDACMSPQDGYKQAGKLLGLATGYWWSKSNQMTFINFTTPCCTPVPPCYYYQSSCGCSYSEYACCPPGTQPDPSFPGYCNFVDYTEAWYIDYLGGHKHGAAFLTFETGAGYAWQFYDSTTQWSDTFFFIAWGSGGYSYGAADGASVMQ